MNIFVCRVSTFKMTILIKMKYAVADARAGV